VTVRCWRKSFGFKTVSGTQLPPGTLYKTCTGTKDSGHPLFESKPVIAMKEKRQLLEAQLIREVLNL
jgi:hypothetical protein